MPVTETSEKKSLLPPEWEAHLVDIDLAGEHLRQNFSTILPEWAKQPPIYVQAQDGLQVVCSRYADVMEVFRDRDRFSVEPPNRVPGRFDRFMGLQALSQIDGARHDRLRRIMAPSFNPTNIQRQAGAIERVVGGLIDAIAAKGKNFDAMQDFGLQLVIGVLLGEMLQMNGEQIGGFVVAGEAIASTSRLRPGEPVPEVTINAFASGRRTVEALIAARRAAPGEDLVSTLVTARDEGDKLSDTELFDQIFIICAAALTTTAGSMGGLLLSLGRNPDQFEQVKQDLTLVPAVVEEGLRIHGPGYLAFARFAIEDTAVGGRHIPKGTAVYCSMQAACYDPEMYPDPMRFDIHRKPRGIPIFGAGVHHCIGQVLARLIIQTSLKLLLERFPLLALADPDMRPRYRGEFGESLLAELPMTTG